ncbi:hypothetical protein DID88_002799 [Monilinia fructigena]|uniref:F-box domain-containing protein n=1 Tax=Monilinia fructigena TaxID=38457 RepID=A0A395INL4_9HELO|nr:hypothetical protein DID88_002799 [Monilinia fructigena]
MASNGLVQVLEGMKLQDGTPDINLRTSAIANLLNSSTLTFGELRMLKDHFDDIDFRRDPIVMFPSELVVRVLEHVDLEDFMTMCRVSRDWREKLFNRKVCGPLLRLHFRGTWESVYVPLSENDRESRLQNISSVFLDVCTKRLKRRRGKWYSVSSYHYPRISNGSRYLNGEPVNELLYRNGRVAAMPDRFSIRIDNLRTQTSMHYMHGQRSPLKDYVLSNELLIAYIDYPKPQFNVWRLDEEEDPIVIHLECHNSIISSHDKQIAFGRKTNNTQIVDTVYVWIDGHIQKLAEPGFGDPDIPNASLEVRLCGFIFHPTEENHYFVFYLPTSWKDTTTKRIIVQEHIAGLPHKTWYHDLISSRFQALNAKLIDNDGLVALVCEDGTQHLPTQPSSFLNHSTSQDPGHCNPNPTFTTFNIITKEFGTLDKQARTFPMPSNPRGERKCDITDFGGRKGLWGDDDFVIESNQHGYVVWNFDPSVTLPASDKDISSHLSISDLKARNGMALEV